MARESAPNDGCWPTAASTRLRWLKSQIETGEFKPVIDRVYPLDKIVEAYRYVETGQKIGNVVIEVENDDQEE